ncbi:hypothetical protein [Mastigocoleus testarum]|uniref:Hydrocarbon-binding protein n=1 Tax=Mastigocoleus testarum BC008 TaxID=371196 RepID=A0A0V8A0B8_9CYAN|nr:hypothetical protein [Mastigocoleus testarum]KST66889.1 hydrocarbon-binding protein [Mastigocoleus testarum BC008]KST70227.1 hydrocarbon-binding protein [Mastigocoleus testarum BC008]
MTRPELGDLCSVVCYKSAVVGMEEALGEKATAIALTAAGRSRGKQLAKELELANLSSSLDTVTSKIGSVLGKDGFRLCNVEKIISEGDIIRVIASETLCSAAEPQGSLRKCTFTLGAVWGILEQVFGKRLRGKQVESVLRGGSHDVFEFSVLG